MADYDDDDDGMWNAGGEDGMIEGVSALLLYARNR